MSGRWYNSRTNQAAIIGGCATLIAVVLTYALTRTTDRYPPVEVKDLTPSGEQVLAKLALSPAKQLLDSAAFAALADRDLIWNDSVGVAIEKPTTHEWGVADMGSLDGASMDDVLFFRWVNDLTKSGFGNASFRGTVRFFGVRLDKPTIVQLTRETRLDSTLVGENLFREPKWFLGFARMSFGQDLESTPPESLQVAQREGIAMLDSVARTYLPAERQIFSGVFVSRVTEASLIRSRFTSFLKLPLLDQAFASIGISVAAPTFLIVDRDRGTMLFSDALRIENAIVDGKLARMITLNRAGYVVQRGSVVHIVMLQYVSTQPAEVLSQLQRYLSSVRLRAASA